MGRACSRHRRYEKDRIIVGKLEGKIPLQRGRCRWDDNIKIYLKEICGDCVAWVYVSILIFWNVM
jgi:hypothetical protein